MTATPIPLGKALEVFAKGFTCTRSFTWPAEAKKVGHAAWTADVFVERRCRRKGIGKALLSTALTEDRTYGLTHAVLTASHAGALLYPSLGYRTIGTLLLFTPPRR